MKNKIHAPSLSHFWGKCVFWHVEDLSWEISYMNDKKNIIVNFIIQKLKNKDISLKKYTDWAILGHVTQNLEFTSWTTSCEPMRDSEVSEAHSLVSGCFGSDGGQNAKNNQFLTYRNVIYLKRSLRKIVIQIWNKIRDFCN
jgi:hypothetical protein